MQGWKAALHLPQIVALCGFWLQLHSLPFPSDALVATGLLRSLPGKPGIRAARGGGKGDPWATEEIPVLWDPNSEAGPERGVSHTGHESSKSTFL